MNEPLSTIVVVVVVGFLSTMAHIFVVASRTPGYAFQQRSPVAARRKSRGVSRKTISKSRSLACEEVSWAGEP